MVTATFWAPSNELLTCSDDKTISRWSAEGELLGKVINQLPAYVTDMSFLPATGMMTSKTKDRLGLKTFMWYS